MSFPISSPIDFSNTTSGDQLNFDSTGGVLKNRMLNFVTETQGDIILRNPVDSKNISTKLSPGNDGQVLTTSGTIGFTETSVTCAADVGGALGGTYFIFFSPTASFYIWFDVDGGSTDPGSTTPTPSDLIFNGELSTGIQVSISTNDTASAIITAMVTAIAGVTEFTTVTPGSPIIEINSVAQGFSDEAVAGLLAPTGFTFDTTQGSTPVPIWKTPSLSTNDMFMATAIAVGVSLTSGTTWTTLNVAFVTWNDSTGQNFDDGNMFNAAAGLVVIPATGRYNISIAVSFFGNNTGSNNAIPSRRAIRQVRIQNSTQASTIIFGESQAPSFSNNPTYIAVASAIVQLTASDVLLVQARHDATSNIPMSIEIDGGVNGPAMYVSMFRVT